MQSWIFLLEVSATAMKRHRLLYYRIEHPS